MKQALPLIPFLAGLALMGMACSRSAPPPEAPNTTDASSDEARHGAVRINSDSVSVGGKSGFVAPGVWISEDGSEMRIDSDGTKVHMSGKSIHIEMDDGKTVTVGDDGVLVGGIEVDGERLTAPDAEDD